MAGRYLTDLADVLRAAGLTVVEYAGWTTRARSSGGYADGRPWAFLWHHTASQTTPANDASYMCNGSPDRPIANLLIPRDGSVWVLAAGATNTNGKGGPLAMSRGTVPADCMNEYAVSAELANAGTGVEPYPVAQIDAAFAASVAVCQWLGLDPGDVANHQTWAPTRKIDPAPADAVEGPWRPRSSTSSGTWHQDDVRAECRRRAANQPPEVPDMTDEQAAQLAQVLDLVQRQAQSDAVWHQTVPDPVTGSDSAMWAQVQNANANAAAALAAVQELRAALGV
jgi:hypothetical protein